MSKIEDNLNKEDLKKIENLKSELPKDEKTLSTEDTKLIEERAKAIAALDNKVNSEKVKKKKIIKSLLIGLGAVAVFGIGLSVGLKHSASLYTLNNNNITTQNVISNISEEESSATIKGYRNIMVTESLKDEFKNKNIDKQVDKQIESIKSQYTKEEFKNLLTTSGYKDEGNLRLAIENNLLTQMFIDSKLSDENLKKEYKNWSGNISVFTKEYKTKEDAQKDLDKFNNTNSPNKEDKLFKSGLKLQENTINNINSNLSKDEFKEVKDLIVGSGLILETNLNPNVSDKTYTLFIKVSESKKEDFDKEKDNLKQAISNEFNTDNGFFREWAKDNKIESKSDFGNKLIQTFK